MSAEKQKTILLVEDEAITAMTEKMILEKYGYKVITAPSGEEAVAAVEKTPAIDLILMDINLGAGIDGTEAAEMILKNHDLPVVFLSSHTEPEIVAKTEKITSYGYVVKDSSGTVLDASIKMAFKLYAAKIKDLEKEEALQASLERFEFANRATFNAIWDWNLRTDKLGWNENFQTLFGYRAEEIEPGIESWKNRIHPEDLDRVKTSIHAAIDSGKQSWSDHYRFRRRDGSYADVDDRGYISRNQGGQPVRMIGAMQDVTERKQAEKELRKRNKYIESILDNMPIGFAVNTIDDGVAKYSNNNFSKIYGWPKEVLTDVDKFFEKVYPGAEGQELKARVINDIGSGDPERMVWDDLKITTGSGEHRYISARNIPILEQNLMVSTVWDTTQIHESLKSLRKSEEKFRSIAEQSSSLVALTDANGFITYASSASRSLFHFAPEEMCGRHFMEFLDEPAVPKATAAFRLALESGARTKNLELPMKRKDGSIFIGELNRSNFRCGEQTETLVIIRDVTERKQAEEKIRDLAKFPAENPLPILRLDKDGVVLYANEASAGLLQHWGSAVGSHAPRFWIEVVAEALSSQSKKTITVDFNEQTYLFDAIPILAAGYVNLYGSDITERKRAESQKEAALEELHQSEEKHRMLFETMVQGVVYQNAEGHITSANPAAERILGLTLDEMMGRKSMDPRWKAIHEDGSDFPGDTHPAMGALKTGKEIRNVIMGVFHPGDNSYHWISINAIPQINQGDTKPHQVYATFEDITERKQAESQREAALQALREREAHYRALVENASDLVYRTDKAGHFTFINQAALAVTGYQEGELVGKHYPTLIRPDKRKKAVALFGRQITMGIYNTYSEFPILTKDGREVWLGQNSQLILEDGQVTGFQAVSRDITEHKRAENTLQKSEAQLANALQMAQAGHWEYDVDHDVFTFNDNFYRIFRTTAAAVGGYKMSSENYARKFCHPDDMAMVGDETRKAIESADPNYSRQVEHRILYADGQVGTIIVRFFISKDPHGRTVKTYGVNQDITWRKLAEEEIKRQLAEKEILLIEVHHRIKNNIAAIGGLISLHLQSVTNPEALAVLKDAIGRVDSMRILYDKLLLSEGYKDVSVKNYVESLADTVISLFPDSARIKLEKHIADFQLDPKRLFPLGLIINELITNKMKYAFSKRKTGLIKISLKNVKNHVTLTIQDNGNRLPEGFDINESKGFGLMLVKMLSQQLGGSFAMEKRAGTRCKLEFDI